MVRIGIATLEGFDGTAYSTLSTEATTIARTVRGHNGVVSKYDQ